MTIHRDAIISVDSLYRYTLWRWFDLTNARYVLFCGLNPSTADAIQDDPTIRRCVDFGKRWGFGGICMVNLFAYRSTEPSVLQEVSDPVGPDNDYWIRELTRGAGLRIAAWGTPGSYLGRDRTVIPILGEVHCLGLTKNGSPRHPLYMPSNTMPIPYSLAA